MFRYILKKEFLLISRDIHALLVLFIMPTLFIIIMSLALQNTYSNTIDTKLQVAINTLSNKDTTHLTQEINKNNYFQAKITNNENIKELMYKKNFDFIVNIVQEYKTQINTNKKDFHIDIYLNPSISLQNQLLFKNLLTEIISKQIMKEYFIKNKIDGKTLSKLNDKISIIPTYKEEKFKIKPTSVQYSVPSWLVFSMFFILIPISNAFINEKNFGTIDRLKSMDIPFISIILGKMVPYFIINQIQVLFMILVGIYIVPLLNGDTLQINGNYGLIFMMSSAISFAAISFAIFIANISSTSEEATTIGGVSNILLAALGGIMVPKFVMPEFMQNITTFSPMNWGLEGLLEIFVMGGGLSDIRTYILYLVIFGCSFLALSYMVLKKKENV
ncbi:MAG: ABC transporter permease [Arcobacteraceae bacterium]|nr:ABC transporter permease [Arcobacteraceae bacterium]